MVAGVLDPVCLCLLTGDLSYRYFVCLAGDTVHVANRMVATAWTPPSRYPTVFQGPLPDSRCAIIPRSLMKRLCVILSTPAFASVFALLAWLFSLHGTKGLAHVEFWFGIGMLMLAVLGVLPLALLLAGTLSPSRSSARPRFGISIAILSSLAIGISVFGFGYVGGFPPHPVGDTPPRLIMAASTGSNGVPDVAVVAESAAATRYILSWGKSGLQSTVKETTASTEHVFMLRDLEPATHYRYRLNQGVEYRFSTPDTASRPLHLAIGSDAHFSAGGSRNDLTARMLTQVADPANRFDYFFSLGDNVEFGFRPEQWLKARAAFAPTTAVIPSTFVAGNHDTMFTGLQRYLAYAYPEGVELQNGTRLWHRIDVGHVHVIVLDVEWSAESFTQQQAAWLETELNTIPAEDWTIVMNHGFYYGSGSVTRGWKWYDNKETIQKITSLFEKYGVDLVLSGHAHQMELLQESGVTYVIDGAFGGELEPPRRYDSPASLWYSSADYGYVDVTVDKASATIIFRDSGGIELKRMVVMKNARQPNP
jgi:hypothetical protein